MLKDNPSLILCFLILLIAKGSTFAWMELNLEILDAKSVKYTMSKL